MASRSLLVDRPLPYERPRHALAALRVARHPDQLAAHLDRLDACDDVTQVFGALVDLFIGLDPGEVEHRRAALDRFGRALSEQELAALDAAVDDGLTATDCIPDAPGSLLTAGRTGILLVANPTPEPPGARAREAASSETRPPRPGPLPAPRSPAPLPPAGDRGRPVQVLVALAALAGAVLWRRRRTRRRA